jgi:hypothetical protein
MYCEACGEMLIPGEKVCIDGRWYCEECADLLDEYTLEEYEDWLVDEDDEQSDWPDPVY